MSEEQEVVDPAVDGEEGIAEEIEIESAQDSDVDPLEAIAREGGWSPQEEWRGDKSQWKDAATFIREGIKIQSKQHDKIDRLQDSIKAVEQNITKMAKTEVQRTKKALEAQRERLAAERQKAFDMQDADKFESVEAEIKTTNAQLDQMNAEQDEVAVFEKTFKERNPWYQEDKAMTAYAIQSAQHLKGAFPELDQDNYMKELERLVKSQFPNEFQNPNKSRAGGVVSGDSVVTDKGSNTPAKKSFDSLPAEAKEAFAELNQYMPNGRKMTKAAYVKTYYEELV